MFVTATSYSASGAVLNKKERSGTQAGAKAKMECETIEAYFGK
jgi:hypothetical protein